MRRIREVILSLLHSKNDRKRAGQQFGVFGMTFITNLIRFPHQDDNKDNQQGPAKGTKDTKDIKDARDIRELAAGTTLRPL